MMGDSQALLAQQYGQLIYACNIKPSLSTPRQNPALIDMHNLDHMIIDWLDESRCTALA
jgi:hypothetical protein